MYGENSANPNSLTALVSISRIFSILLILVGVTLLLTPVAPNIWYSLNDEATESEVKSIISVVDASDNGLEGLKAFDPNDTEYIGGEVNSNGVRLPSLDKTLNRYNTIVIPSIGVNSALREGINPNKELEKGIWRTYDWGTPEDRQVIILAAHRFGYISWTQEFRKTSSFYKLPDLKIGDEVEIIWKQRKYKYKVVNSDTGTSFSSLDYDLILYTCQMFNTPVRIFKYLERTN